MVITECRYNSPNGRPHVLESNEVKGCRKWGFLSASTCDNLVLWSFIVYLEEKISNPDVDAFEETRINEI